MTKSPYPPKTRRPSRRARLPYAIISDPLSTFEPTAANWQAMEGAYDRPLGDDDREEIVKLVTNYFHLGQFGRNASFVDDAEKWLAKVQKAAESTQNDLGVFSKELFPDEQTENSAEFHARYRIKQHLKERRRWPEHKIEYVQNVLKDYLDAIALTAKELETASSWGPIEEIQWGILIIGLTKWFKDNRFPVGASKGANKSTSDKPSAFVAFVHALQLTFPKEYQRHMPNPGVLVTAINLGALATGIYNARRCMAREMKSGDARSQKPA